MGLEIEHILPNTPEPELRQSFSTSNPGANYDEYKNRLGNFTLLEKPINIVASNNFYEAKKAEYKKCKHYLTRSLVELTVVGNNSSINRINKKLKSFDKWSAASIHDQRQSHAHRVGERGVEDFADRDHNGERRPARTRFARNEGI